MKEKILVIDDKENIREMLCNYLTEEGFYVDTAKDGREGIKLFSQNIHDLVITDVRMPEMNGMDVLKEIKEINFEIPVIMVTAFAEVEDAVIALRLGAYDYIKKPFRMDEISATIQKALEYIRLQKENKYLRKELEVKYSFRNMIGKSKVMQEIFSKIESVASLKTTVLITGETGVGKELLARAIHYSGERKGKNFIPVNCGALPENLLESELFGYEKGAFTDAKVSKLGRFEEAEGGTIFLDEICEFPLSIQVKMVRILQDGELFRLGESKPRHVDVRIIAATNRNIEEEVETGKFRADLYYRINVIRFHIPPLRQRREDIPLLLNFYLQKYNNEQKKNIINFNNDALRALMSYSYPGNIRELQNIVEKGVFLSKGEYIDIDDLQLELLKGVTDTDAENVHVILPEGIFSSKKCLKDVVGISEKELIKRALIEANGNKEKSASLLGISERALFYKIKKYGL